MKKTLMIIWFSLISLTIYSQENQGSNNHWGESVIHDYLICYENQPEKYSSPRFWFDDLDTRRMIAGFIETKVDTTATDTIFFNYSRSEWGSQIELVSGDTLLWIKLKYMDGYRTFVVQKMPFRYLYSNTYLKELHAWDREILAAPSGELIFDAPHYYVVRLLYNKRQLISAEFCHHEAKSKYISFDYTEEEPTTLPYPENKQWPLW